MSFDVKFTTKYCIEWIKDWFTNNANENTVAVIGISGGKDSTVTAGLLVKALGKDRVFGVLMPEGTQKDIDDAKRVCKFLDIKSTVINIGSVCKSLYHEMLGDDKPNNRVSTNVPSRIRMTTLYAVAATYNNGNCRVTNTSNLSEDIVGYATIFGDAAGDFAPLARLTTDEVVSIGKYLELPIDLVEKAPSDGMTGKTDEDVIGITYKEINDLCRKGVVGKNYDKILEKYRNSLFKTRLIQIPCFEPTLPNFLKKDEFKDGSLILDALHNDFGEVAISPHMERATVIHVTEDNLSKVYEWLKEYISKPDFAYNESSLLEDYNYIEVNLFDGKYSTVKSINIGDYVVVNNKSLIVYMGKEELLKNWVLVH